jgi:hypothetical protein
MCGNDPAAKRKLGPLIPVIEAILEADRTAPVNQRHTARRIFERLRDEHRFAGGYTVVNEEMGTRHDSNVWPPPSEGGGHEGLLLDEETHG